MISDQYNSTINEYQNITGDLIGNKIANKITKVSRNSPQDNSETNRNAYDTEIPKERHISLEERQFMIWY